LTVAIEIKLSDEFKESFSIIKEDLETMITERKVNIEDILNHVRKIRELTVDSDKEYISVSGNRAKGLDKEICK